MGWPTDFISQQVRPMRLG